MTFPSRLTSSECGPDQGNRYPLDHASSASINTSRLVSNYGSYCCYPFYVQLQYHLSCILFNSPKVWNIMHVGNGEACKFATPIERAKGIRLIVPLPTWLENPFKSVSGVSMRTVVSIGSQAILPLLNALVTIRLFRVSPYPVTKTTIQPISAGDTYTTR